MNMNFNLFKNNKTKDSQPDYRGNDKDNTHEVACWVKEGKNGKYFSCVIKPKEDKPKHQSTQNSFTSPDNENDLPF